MNMMKLAWQKFLCVLGCVFPPIRLCSGLSLATKVIGTLAAPLLLLATCYFSLATIHLTTPSLVTATFSACCYYLAEIRLSEPSAPRWVRHSYLSKGLRLIPYTCGSSWRLWDKKGGDGHIDSAYQRAMEMPINRYQCERVGITMQWMHLEL